MLILAGAAPEDRWNDLQQPAHPAHLEPEYRVLLAALELGWRVEEPVYLRPRWSESGPRVFHFILRRTSHTPPKLVTVPEGPEVDGFVRAEGLRLVVGR